MRIEHYAQDIMIRHDDDGFRVLYRTAAYGPAHRLFADEQTARRFAAGDEVLARTPRKGRAATIRASAKYKGPDEKWTEHQTGEETLSAPAQGYHFGKSGATFAPITTCFYRQWNAERTAVPAGTFIAEFPVGTRVEYYDDEIRVDLSQPGIRIFRLVSEALV